MTNESIYDRMTKAEKEVADVLKNLGIQWSYELLVFVWDENRRPRVWTPDFHLIQFGIYLEVCGSKGFNYNYRKQVFHNYGYSVIFLHIFKGTKLWRRHFIKYLRYFLTRREHFYSIIFQDIV